MQFFTISKILILFIAPSPNAMLNFGGSQSFTITADSWSNVDPNTKLG